MQTVFKFWVFGSSLEGLPRAQNRHPEGADSSSDLLEKLNNKLIKKAMSRKRRLIRFSQPFVNFWGFGCRFFGCILKVFFFFQNVLKTCNCRQNLLFRSRNDPKTWSIRQILRSRQRGAEQHGEAGEPNLTNVCRNRGRRVRGQREKINA